MAGRQPHLFLDCDGVLADFDAGAKSLLGVSAAAFENRHGKGEFWKRLARAGNFYGDLRRWRGRGRGCEVGESETPFPDDAVALYDRYRQARHVVRFELLPDERLECLDANGRACWRNPDLLSSGKEVLLPACALFRWCILALCLMLCWGIPIPYRPRSPWPPSFLVFTGRFPRSPPSGPPASPNLIISGTSRFCEAPKILTFLCGLISSDWVSSSAGTGSVGLCGMHPVCSGNSLHLLLIDWANLGDPRRQRLY